MTNLLHTTVVQNSNDSRRKYWSTRLSVRSFARSLAPLARLLAPHCSLCLHALLRSFVCLLTHSLASLWESELLDVSKGPGFAQFFIGPPFLSFKSKSSWKTQILYIYLLSYIYKYYLLNRDLRCCLINWKFLSNDDWPLISCIWIVGSRFMEIVS